MSGCVSSLAVHFSPAPINMLDLLRHGHPSSDIYIVPKGDSNDLLQTYRVPDPGLEPSIPAGKANVLYPLNYRLSLIACRCNVHGSTQCVPCGLSLVALK